jgi:hypothetical protein
LVSGNLIANPGAEAGPGSASGDDVEVIPSWTTANGFTAVQYQSTEGNFPSSTDPGPPNRGANFFAGGDTAATATATQTISLANAASAIATGDVEYNLCGWLGGFSTQDDNAVLTATFENAGGTALGTPAQIGPVTEAQRGGQTGLLLQSTSGTVPSGATQVVVTLTMTRLEGTYNDGYADSLDLSISASDSAPIESRPRRAVSR